MHSTANDLLKFLSVGLGFTPCSLTSALKKTQTAHRTGPGLETGLGWEELSPTVEAQGLTFGSRVYIGFDPVSRRGLVVLANCYNDPVLSGLKCLLKNRSPKPFRTAEVDPKIYDGYVGQYRLSNGHILAVHREANRLLMQRLERTGQEVSLPSFELFPESATCFYNHFVDVWITFTPEGQGQAARLKLIADGNPVLEGTRISTQLPQPPVAFKADPTLLNLYSGQYRFAWGPFHFGPVISFNREQDQMGDHLVVQVVGMGGLEMYPESENTFFTPIADAWATFVRNKSGKVTHLMGRAQGEEVRLVKTSDTPVK
jgi:hypothetical protein